MKRYIRISFIITFVLTIAIVIGASFTLFRREITDTVRESLKGTVTAIQISEMPPGIDPQSFVKKLSSSSEGLRVTLIDYDGTVVSDSERAAGSMENHRVRPEIAQAIQAGYGEDIRKSETTGITSIYVAVPLDETYLIRLSLPLSTTYSFLRAMAPVTIVVCLMLLIFIYVFAEHFSRKLIAPFHKIGTMLGDLVRGNYHDAAITPAFPELEQSLANIRTLAGKLQSNVEEIREKKAQLDNLLHAAIDGIILLSGDGSVISINAAARNILTAPAEVVSFRGICRIPELTQEVMATLHDGAPRVYEMDLSDTRGRYYRVFINPAKDEHGVLGAILFLSDITEIVRLERMRSEFFANASHELKSPLTSIKGFSELMAAGLVDDEAQRRDYASRIVKESERLLTLINDLLHLSELESVRANPLTFEQLDLRALTAEVYSQLEARAVEKDIALSIEGYATLCAEKQPIFELIYNLVDNAIKYGREHGKCIVKLFEDEKKCELRVYDNGIGIAPEHQTRIFERFYKTDRSRSRKMGSTGLGLAIVKHTAKRYGGTVAVQSEPGVYTEMIVAFEKS